MNESERHPQKDQLIAFGLGTLEPDEADQVAAHLYDCQDCSETIVNLQDDTFVSLVRSSPAPAPVDEAQLEASGSEAAQHDVTVDVAFGLSGDDKGPPVELPAELLNHPRYEIQEWIGRGGMGDVYKAQHRMMNRAVALKVIKPELIRNAAAVERFRREVQAAARLRHPNIVTAHDAEQAGGLHYLVMEYVDGENLDEITRRDGPLALKEACDYIRQAAEGLQHAHDLGMVHRDIKPHNLMIERQTGTIIGNATVVKILDFGLANFANEVAAETLSTVDNNGQAAETAEPDLRLIAPGGSIVQQLTQMGAMMGTPDYMAPEQAQDAHAADIRADIYSLGCTFYTLLTGKAPFSEGSVLDKIKAHTQQAARPLSDFRDDVPQDVEAVIVKMMAKDPAERYQTPAEVAEALSSVAASFQLGEAEAKDRHAGSSSPRRRRPLVLTAVAALFLTLLAAAATIFYIQTDNGVVRVEVTDPSLKVTISGQTITMDDGDKSLTIRAGEQKLIVRQKDSDFELVTDSFQLRRGDNVAIKADLLPDEIVVMKDSERFGAKSLREKFDNRPVPPPPSKIDALLKDATLALSFGKESFYQQDGAMFVRDLSGNGNDALCEEARYSAEGPTKSSVLIESKGKLRIPRRLIGSGEPFTIAAWVHRDLPWDDGDPLVFAQSSEEGSTEMSCGLGIIDAMWYLDFVSSDAHMHYPFGDDVQRSGRFARGSDWGFVAWTREKPGELSFTVDGRTQQTEYKDLGNGEEDAHTHVEVGRGLNGGLDELIVFDRALTPAELKVLYQFGRDGRSVELPESARSPAEVVLQRKFGQGMPLESLAVLPDGRVLMTTLGGDTGRVVIWNKETGRAEVSFPVGTADIQTSAVSLDGSLMLTAIEDRRRKHFLQLWDLRKLYTPATPQKVPSHIREMIPTVNLVPNWTVEQETPIEEVVFARTGPSIREEDWKFLVRDAEGKIHLHRTMTGEFVETLLDQPVSAMALSAEQLQVIAKIDNGPARVVRVNGVKGPELPVQSMTSAVYSPRDTDLRRVEGDWIVTGDASGNIHVWKSRTGEMQREWSAGDEEIVSLAFDADGQRLFCASRQRITAWDFETGRLLATADVPDFHVTHLALTLDEKSLITGGRSREVDQQSQAGDHCLRLWRLPENVRSNSEPNVPAATLSLDRRLHGHRGPAHGIGALSASADGRLLLSAGNQWDRTARLWDVETGETLLTMRTRSDQPLAAVALSPDGKLAALLGDDELDIWDVEGKKRVQQWTDTANRKRLVFSPDGKRLVTLSQGSRTRIWDVQSGEVIHEHSFRHSANDAKFVPGTSLVYVAAHDGWWSWNPENDRVYPGLGSNFSPPVTWSLDISADGGKLAVATSRETGTGPPSYTIEVYDRTNNKRLSGVTLDRNANCVRFLPHDRYVISTSTTDRMVRIWDMGAQEPPGGREVARRVIPNNSWNVVAPLSGGRVATFGESLSPNPILGEDAILIWRLPESVWPNPTVRRSAKTR